MVVSKGTSGEAGDMDGTASGGGISVATRLSASWLKCELRNKFKSRRSPVNADCTAPGRI